MGSWEPREGQRKQCLVLFLAQGLLGHHNSHLRGSNLALRAQRMWISAELIPGHGHTGRNMCAMFHCRRLGQGWNSIHGQHRLLVVPTPAQHLHGHSLEPKDRGLSPEKPQPKKGKTRLRRTKEAHFQQKGVELTQTAFPTTSEHVRHRQEQSPGPACHPQGVLSYFYSPWCFPQNHSPHATTEGHKHG